MQEHYGAGTLWGRNIIGWYIMGQETYRPLINRETYGTYGPLING
jgi:hypothetical protein